MFRQSSTDIPCNREQKMLKNLFKPKSLAPFVQVRSSGSEVIVYATCQNSETLTPSKRLETGGQRSRHRTAVLQNKLHARSHDSTELGSRFVPTEKRPSAAETREIRNDKVEWNDGNLNSKKCRTFKLECQAVLDSCQLLTRSCQAADTSREQDVIVTLSLPAMLLSTQERKNNYVEIFVYLIIIKIFEKLLCGSSPSLNAPNYRIMFCEKLREPFRSRIYNEKPVSIHPNPFRA